MTLDCFKSTLGIRLHGYLLNHWGMYNSVVIHLSKIVILAYPKRNYPQNSFFAPMIKIHLDEYRLIWDDSKDELK